MCDGVGHSVVRGNEDGVAVVVEELHVVVQSVVADEDLELLEGGLALFRGERSVYESAADNLGLVCVGRAEVVEGAVGCFAAEADLTCCKLVHVVGEDAVYAAVCGHEGCVEDVGMTIVHVAHLGELAGGDAGFVADDAEAFVLKLEAALDCGDDAFLVTLYLHGVAVLREVVLVERC